MSIRDRYEQIYHDIADMSGAQGGLHLGGNLKGQKCVKHYTKEHKVKAYKRRPCEHFNYAPKKRSHHKKKALVGQGLYGGCDMEGGYSEEAMHQYEALHGMGRKGSHCIKHKRGSCKKYSGGQALSNDFFNGEGRHRRGGEALNNAFFNGEGVRGKAAAERSPWIGFLRAFAHDNGINYAQALRTPGIGDIYRSEGHYYKKLSKKKVSKKGKKTIHGVDYY